MGAKCWSTSSSVETITGRKAKSWATLRIRNAVKKRGGWEMACLATHTNTQTHLGYQIK